MDPAVTCLLVLVAAVALFLWNRLPVGVVAVGTSLSLYLTGLLDAGESLAGFGDPVVIFVAALFVVSEALDATGITAWAGDRLTALTDAGRQVLVAAVMGVAAVLTAVISPNGSVAALLPVVMALALRGGHPPSQLALPLAFAAHAGSLLALSGSPVNILVSDAAADATGTPFGFFEFAILGLPLLVATTAVAVVLGPRLLPSEGTGRTPPDLSRHAHTLAGHYALGDGFYRLLVLAGSPLVGATMPHEVESVTTIGVQSADGTVPSSGRPLAAGDTIVATGPAEDVRAFASSRRLSIEFGPLAADALLTRETGVVEVVVPPRSALVGERVFPGMLRLGQVLILAVSHRGRERTGPATTLTEGDALVLRGPWTVIDTLVDDRDVLVVDAPDMVRRQAVPLGLRAKEALAVLAVMVVLLGVGAATPALVALAAAAALVALGVLRPYQAYRAVSWQTVVLLGGLIPLSTAITTSGASATLADGLLAVVDGMPPIALLVALFLVTAALGQVISNTATVLVILPVALAAAAESGIAVAPVLMTVAVAGAASFLTPIATPANMMVMGPGGYRFGDYWRLGGVVQVTWLALTLLIVPLAWPLT